MDTNFETFDDYRNIDHSLIDDYITASKNTTLETLQNNTHLILENFAQSIKQTLKIIETSCTGKSIFGIIELNGQRKFFKIASAERIFGEIKGYISANHYPHVGISNCYFDQSGAGLLIQPECENLEENLFLNQSNNNLKNPSPEYLQKSKDIISHFGSIYQETLVELGNFHGVNDDFFRKRLLPGGNIDKFYGKEGINLGGKNIGLDNLIINGIELKSILNQAKLDFNNSKKRLYVESQGDPTEANIAFPNTFFDFETGGINALSQDIAIFLVYSYYYGHYLVPKKNHFETSLTNEVSEFKNKVNGELIKKEENSFMINIQFPIPAGKEYLLKEYIRNVVKPIEDNLNSNQVENLIKEVRSAIIMRFLAVKNLNNLEENEKLVMLYMTSHFFDIENYSSLAKYLESKFCNF